MSTTCAVCKTQFSDEEFDALPLPKKCKTPEDAITEHEAGRDPVREPAYRLMYRDCLPPCRNTLTRVLDVMAVRYGGRVLSDTATGAS
jgi:hypothetical protein